MAKTPVSFHIDGDLLANLEAYAAQTGCTVTALIERFCQQGLDTELVGAVVETDIKSILKRLSVLESKVDVDIDVDDYLQTWQNSLEIKIASLVDTFVEKRVEEILESAHRLAKIEQSEQAPSASDAKPIFIPTRSKGLLDDYRIDFDCDDEPDEILTDFLE